MLPAAALHRSQGGNDCLFSVRDEGCSVPDVVQTAAQPKAPHSTQTHYKCFRQDTVCYPPPQILLCSIQHDLFNATDSVWFIWCVTITFTGWMFREQALERVPSAFCCFCARGSSCPLADHVVSKKETLADEHMVPSPQTMACLSCPQLWVSSSQWLLLTSQACRQSQMEPSTAAPERVEPGCKNSVWHGTWPHGDIHTKLCQSLSSVC